MAIFNSYVKLLEGIVYVSPSQCWVRALRTPGRVGACWASQPRLATAVLANLSWHKALEVLQVGIVIFFVCKEKLKGDLIMWSWWDLFERISMKIKRCFLFFVGQEHEHLVYQPCWLRLLWFSHFTFYFMFIVFGFCLFLFPLFTLMALGDLMDVPQLCPLVFSFTYLPEITTSIGKSSRNGPISIALFS